MVYKKIEPTGGSGGAGATTLDDLTDVSTAGATSGQVLKFDGATWSADTDDARFADPQFTLNATDISNKYVDLQQAPTTGNETIVDIIGGTNQKFGVDFTLITNGVDNRRLSWDGLGMESLLASGDMFVVTYD